jgi:hypothetical protein
MKCGSGQLKDHASGHSRQKTLDLTGNCKIQKAVFDDARRKYEENFLVNTIRWKEA